jgi:hypothetical protein
MIRIVVGFVVVVVGCSLLLWLSPEKAYPQAIHMEQPFQPLLTH